MQQAGGFELDPVGDQPAVGAEIDDAVEVAGRVQVIGFFQLGLQTKLEQTDAALKVARDTLRQFIAEGASEAELAQAKSNLTGGFPLRIDSNRKILDYLSVIGFYRLPLDYLNTWVDKVNAVDVAAVKQAFARRLDADKLVTVVVGAEGAR